MQPSNGHAPSSSNGIGGPSYRTTGWVVDDVPCCCGGAGGEQPSVAASDTSTTPRIAMASRFRKGGLERLEVATELNDQATDIRGLRMLRADRPHERHRRIELPQRRM